MMKLLRTLEDVQKYGGKMGDYVVIDDKKKQTKKYKESDE